MNAFIAFELTLLVVILGLTYLGVVNPSDLQRAAIGIGIWNVILAAFAWFGWPIIRGDVSDLASISKVDSMETSGEETQSALAKPSSRFITWLIGIGLLSLAIALGATAIS